MAVCPDCALRPHCVLTKSAKGVLERNSYRVDLQNTALVGGYLIVPLFGHYPVGLGLLEVK